MPETTLVESTTLTSPVALEFPGLASLGLSGPELDALRRQGFVVREARSAKGYTVFKLRFRIGGNQRTRYLGNDPLFVRAIQDELGKLQAETKHARNVRRLLRGAALLLRQTKARLAPLLITAGYHYHGLAIRRMRNASPERKRNSDPQHPQPAARGDHHESA